MVRIPRFVFGVAIISMLLCVNSASAQRSFGNRSNTLVSIAANEAVQKELGISGDAVTRLNSLNDDYRNASQKELTALGIDYSALADLPAAERAAEMRQVSEKTTHVNRKLNAVFQPKLAETLSPEQVARLKQIQLQAAGIDVWTEPEFSKELDLTTAQTDQLTALRNEYNRRQQQLDGDFMQRFARIRELNAERDGKALTLLTPPQQAKLTELKGQPFDVSQLGFRRRGNN